MLELRPTSTDNRIRSERVRTLVRLLGELREIGVGEVARMHLGSTLLHDLGAAVGGVVLDGNYRLGKTHTIRGATLVGFDDSSVDVFTVHERFGSGFNPHHREMMKDVSETTRGIVCSRPLAANWETSEFANDYARPVGLDHFVGAIRVFGSFFGEGMGFMREKKDRCFTDEDREVLGIVVAEAPRFFGDPERRLAPRVRQTLDELLRGKSDKEIASALNLSPHTVHQYVKEIFRRYDVHGRVELMVKIRNR